MNHACTRLPRGVLLIESDRDPVDDPHDDREHLAPIQGSIDG